MFRDGTIDLHTDVNKTKKEYMRRKKKEFQSKVSSTDAIEIIQGLSYSCALVMLPADAS